MLNDSSIDAIIAIDQQRTVVAWNTTAETLYGLLKADVLNKPLVQVAAIVAGRCRNPACHPTRLLKGIKSFVPASKSHPHRLQVENHFYSPHQ